MKINLLQENTPDNQKNIVQRTLETYSPNWIVIHETLQNAIDAIQRSGNNGKVTIVIDLTSNKVITRDNGNGFPHNSDLLLMGGGDKANDPNYWKYGGSQGVGLKAVYFPRNFLRSKA